MKTFAEFREGCGCDHSKKKKKSDEKYSEMDQTVEEGVGLAVAKAIDKTKPPLGRPSKRRAVSTALKMREIMRDTEKNKKRRFSGKAAVAEGFKQMPGERMASQRDRLEGKARDLEKGRETKKKSERAAKYRMQSNSIRNAGLQDFNAKGEKYHNNFHSKYRREETEIEEGAAWTKKSGKNSEGGLNEKGRKSYEAENPGSDLKAPSKKVGNPRRASFCARMSGMKKKLTSKKTANDPDSRINKSLRAWNC